MSRNSKALTPTGEVPLVKECTAQAVLSTNVPAPGTGVPIAAINVGVGVIPTTTDIPQASKKIEGGNKKAHAESDSASQNNEEFAFATKSSQPDASTDVEPKGRAKPVYDYADAAKRMSVHKMWSEYSEDEEINDYFKKLGITYLERRAVSKAAIEGTIQLPIDFQNVVPRISKWFEAAAKVAHQKVVFNGPSVGTVQYTEAWIDNDGRSQRYLDSFDTEEKRSEKRLLTSVIDLFQGMLFQQELPMKDVTAGSLRQACLFVEKYHETVNSVPRSETAEILNRGDLRNKVLEQMKMIFTTSGIASNILNLAEIISLKTFERFASKVEDEYVDAVTLAVRPTVTQLAHSFYRTVTEEVKTSVGTGRSRQDVMKKVVKKYPPVISCAPKDIGSITTISEQTFLKNLNIAMADSRSDKAMRICEGALRDQTERVKSYVGNQYEIANAIRGILRTRLERVKIACVKEAKLLQKEGDKKLSAFDQVMWAEQAHIYMSNVNLEVDGVHNQLMSALKFDLSEEYGATGISLQRYLTWHFAECIDARENEY